jgi:hypothetical protein
MHITRRTLTVLALAVVLVTGACTSGPHGGNALEERSLALRLVASLRPFRACDELLTHARAEARAHAGPTGLPTAGGFGGRELAFDTGRVASPAAALAAAEGSGVSDQSKSADGPAMSGTNVQEAGVDEPDTVKTDGKSIFALAQGRLQVLEVAGGGPRSAGSLELPGGAHDLLLAGDHLLVLASGWQVQPFAPAAGWREGDASLMVAPGAERTIITLVDVADASHPRVESTLEVDGHVLGARMVGDVARVVTSAAPAGFSPVFATGPSAEDQAKATEANRRQMEESTLRNWLPHYRLQVGPPGAPSARETSGILVDCERVSRPAEFSGLSTISVLTFDLSEGLGTGDAVSVLADGQTVYASAGALYVATSRYGSDAIAVADAVATAPPSLSTDIHRFAIGGTGPARHVASGRVRGHLLNQFSMSEQDGRLRVATTDGTSDSESPGGPGVSPESFVTVLEDRGGELAVAGQVGNLGRGERIYAVRFLGDVGYVVTFRQTDPLYTIDLSDPARPRVAGELKLPGYSAYLHPVGEGLLLGVGQDATDAGRRLGAQVSLFDVSDPARPERLDQIPLGQGLSQAEFDHHAFLWWAPRGLVVLPLQLYAPEAPQFTGAVGLSVGRDRGLSELGRLSHGGEPISKERVGPPGPGDVPMVDRWSGDVIQRSLVIGEVLYTVSDRGVLASSVADFSRKGWVGF